MLLLASEGESISGIARNLGTCRIRVGQWVRRFRERRLEGLEDLPRSGRPAQITPLERHQVIATACRTPGDFGFERVLWDHATLAIAVMSAGLVRSIRSRTVGRILEDAEIKPHRVKMWCHSDDPAYQEKMRAIVDLYVNLPKGEPVLSIGGKTGMQALSRRRPLQAAAAGATPVAILNTSTTARVACSRALTWARGKSWGDVPRSVSVRIFSPSWTGLHRPTGSVACMSFWTI